MRHFVLLIVGALLGYGVAVLTQIETPVREPSSGLNAAPEEEVSKNQGLALEALDVGTRSREEERREPVSETVVRSGGGQAFVSSIPQLAVEDGDGLISGRVVLGSDQPLAGVRVEASPRNGPSEFRRASSSDSLVEYARRSVQYETWRRAAKKVATTNSNGEFELAGLVSDHEYRVSFTLAGYSFSAKNNARLWSLRPGVELLMLAKPMVTLALDVRLPDGSPAKTAGISFKSGSSSTTKNWSAESKEIDHEPGSYTIWASSKDQTLESEKQDVVLEGSNANLVLELRTVSLLSGRIRSEAQEDFSASCQVFLARVRPGESPAPEKLSRSRLSQMFHPSFGEPFRFKGLDAGTYALAAFVNSKPITAIEIVEFDGTTQEVELRRIASRRSDFVAVQVLGPDGEVVANPSIQTGVKGSNGSRSGGGGSTIGKEGGWIWATHQESPGFVDPEYFVVVQTAFGKKEVPYERTAASEVTVTFSLPSTLEVTITGADELLLDQLSVQFQDSELSYYMGRRSESVESGPLRKIGPVQPGPHTLRLVLATGERYSRGTQVLATQELVLLPGPNETAIAVPPLYSLTVEFPDGQEGLQVRMNREGARGQGPAASRVLGEDKKVVFESFPEGNYVVRVWGGPTGSQEMEVSIPAQTHVVFQATKRNALKVTISKEDHPFAKAGFRDGDLIVGVDGTRFENQMQMQVLVMGAASKEKVAFDVQRAGARLVIEVDGPEIMKSQMQGGVDMQPATVR